MTAITTDAKYATNSALVVKSAVSGGGSTSSAEEDDDDDDSDNDGDNDEDSRSPEEVVGYGCAPKVVLLILLEEGDKVGDAGGDFLPFDEVPWLWFSTSVERSRSQSKLCDRRTLESPP